MKKIRWGILSTARIGTEKVIPAMQRGEHCEIVAIGSQSLDRAQAAAAKLKIPKAHGSYESLLSDPDVEAIYNPLPNHLHTAWSKRALEAGKHVLCEKPLSPTYQEAAEFVAFAARFPKLKVMEAFMYRFHPQWEQARQFVHEGSIGQLRSIHTVFSYFNVNPQDIRNQSASGGGGLLDIGCYCISLSRWLFQREPSRVVGCVEYDPTFKTDRLASALLDFGSGQSLLTCSTQMVPFQRMLAFGTDGRIEIEIPFNAPPDRPCKMWLQTVTGTQHLEMPVCDQYTLQGDRFSKAILEDLPVPTPLSDAVANLRVIDAVQRSSRDRGWTAV